jgi:16S rRNA (guanine527-N7)-methyltransferase
VRPQDVRSRLTRRAAKASIYFSDELADQLTSYYELLARWNRKINLTALDNLDEAIDRLLLEPVVAARFVPSTATSLMDIGSGGGSPALPLKLAVPRLRLVMVESKARKSAFLREAVRQLNLAEAAVETARYEELLARPELHEAHSLLSLRAVRVEPRVLTSLQAFVASNGNLLLFRGPSGPESPTTLVPPLEWVATHPLVPNLQSRLTILRKRPIGEGMFHVEQSV